MWNKFVKFLKKFLFIEKILVWCKLPIPYLSQIGMVMSGLIAIGEQVKKYILKKNQEDSDAKVNAQVEAQKTIETEVAKPLPQQNNDVLREAARKRARGK